MSWQMPASRWSAAAIHLAMSGLIVGGIAAAVIVLWFPAGLWHLSGLQLLFGIMLGADIVLGPLLTLVVYRRRKPGLVRDLVVIGAAQAAFLAYGVHTLWLSRPLVLVGSQQVFALVFANELPASAPARLERMEARRFHGRGPWLVGVDLSSDAARDAFMYAYIAGDGGPLRNVDLYVPYDRVRKAVLAHALAPEPPQRQQLTKQGQVRVMAATSIRSPPAQMVLGATTGEPLRVVP